MQGTHSSGVYSVTVANTQLAVVASSTSSITANFPASAPVANSFAGSYLLTVAFLNGSGPDTSPTGTATFQIPQLGGRQTTNLQFTFVLNTNGFNTGFEISNTSKDAVGSPQISGTCTLVFYGTRTPSGHFVTPYIPSGASYSDVLSSVAPGFTGYRIATCGFPANGTAFVSEGTSLVASTPVVVLNQ